ncbi:ATP-binding protein [Streptomyces sp. NPDC050738]|uniref:ATP-binding protein n=1 Tax=Streptomyces sp. NPDC050738 TaxID=3154744 RepID=UPI003447A1A9
MPEPQPVAGGEVLRRFQQLLEARGLGHITAGPTDDAPSPEMPGHPEYHHRQRVAFALKRWETATPYLYQQATATHPEVTAWADRVAQDPRKAGFLFLTGPFGTGKTHQAYGALRRIAETAPDQFQAIALTAPDMYALLRPGGSDRGAEFELKNLARVPLLLLDDLGTEKISDFTEEATYRLLNTRYVECRPLIITSNLPAKDPNGPDLTDKVGGRITSRLSQMTTVVAMDGPDLRRMSA